MFPIPQQLSDAAKSQFEEQLKIFNTLTSKTFEGVEKIIALNLSTGKAALENTSAAAKHLLSSADPREFISFSASQAQPNIENLLAYSRQWFGIASGAQAELLQSAKVRLDAAAPVLTPIPAPAAATPKVAAAPVPAKPVEAAKPAPVIQAVAAPVEHQPKPVVKAAPAPAPVISAKVAPAAQAKVEVKPAAAQAAPAALKTVATPAKPAEAAPAAKPEAPAVKAAADPAVKAAPASATPGAAPREPKQLDMLTAKTAPKK